MMKFNSAYLCVWPTRPVVWSPPSLPVPSPPLVLAQSRQRLSPANGWLPRPLYPSAVAPTSFSSIRGWRDFTILTLGVK